MNLNELTENVIGAAVEVHKALGRGLLGSAYLACLCQELKLRNIPFESERLLPAHYKGIDLECGCKIDVLVANVPVPKDGIRRRVLGFKE